MLRNYCFFISLSVAVMLSSFAEAKPTSNTDLSTAIHQLKKHINKTSTLNPDQINQQSAIIEENIDQIGHTSKIISKAIKKYAIKITTIRIVA